MHDGPYGKHIDKRMSPIMSQYLNSSLRISGSQDQIILESEIFPHTEIGGGVLVKEIKGWDEKTKVM